MADTDLVTLDQFQQVLPKQLKTKVSQKMVDDLNSNIKDPIFRENYRDNLLGYVNVLQDGKFKMEQYLSAVMYCSYKFGGDTNLNAYCKTFPDRYSNFLANGTSEKDIASYVTSYNKNKLVQMIMGQAMTPTHILNQDIFQKAINIQAEIMTDMNVSPKVRSDAANSLMTHLKAPETKKLEVDVAVKEDNMIGELRNAVKELAHQQRQAIGSGHMTAKEVAHSVIIDVEAEEV